MSIFFASAAQKIVAKGTQVTGNISAEEKAKLVQTLESDIRENYVFPDRAIQISDDLSAFERSPEYRSATDSKTFAALLKERLQSFTHDKHLGVEYSAKSLQPDEFNEKSPSPGEAERQLQIEKDKNYCFQKIERMAGNIGYLDLRCFDDLAVAGPTGAAAMQFLGTADSLILDLRHNGGGNPNMVAFLISYLVGPNPVHLNDLQFRASNRTQQSWTFAYVPGERMPDKAVFVLTSNRTFSAAEEFTYDLQTLKRATIVGEVTRGGANFGAGFVLSEHMFAIIPVGRATNPITHTNWEGVGVHPDVPVQADKALDTAYLLALQGTHDQPNDPHLKEEIQTALKETQTRLNQ